MTLAFALDASGADGAVTNSTDWAGTLFAPVDGAALAAAEAVAPQLARVGQPAPGDEGVLAALMLYAQLPELRRLPSDFADEDRFQTRLPGHDLDVVYTRWGGLWGRGLWWRSRLGMNLISGGGLGRSCRWFWAQRRAQTAGGVWLFGRRGLRVEARRRKS
jgi:hypothetical protein